MQRKPSGKLGAGALGFHESVNLVGYINLVDYKYITCYKVAACLRKTVSPTLDVGRVRGTTAALVVLLGSSCRQLVDCADHCLSV